MSTCTRVKELHTAIQNGCTFYRRIGVQPRENKIGDIIKSSLSFFVKLRFLWFHVDHKKITRLEI